MTRTCKLLGLAASCLAGVSCASSGGERLATDRIDSLADSYYADVLSRTPEAAYFAGVELDRHDGLTDNSTAAFAAAEAARDAFVERLATIDPEVLVGTPQWITYAYLRQALSAAVARRVCRAELWNVNQMSGWHLGYTALAQLQPVDTPALREQALTRWARLPAFIDREISHLERGLALGYSAPRPVVKRVLAQLDGILTLAPAESPFYVMAERANDTDFAAALETLIETRLQPAMRRYRDYLADHYLDAARTALSVTANPNGRDCYEATLRGYTTLDRSGAEVYELGRATVAANRAAVLELGKKAYGRDDFATIVAAAKADTNDRFDSRDALLEFSRAAVRRAADGMPEWVGRMPAQPVEVVPFPQHEEGTGRSAHYRPGSAERPGEYRIPLFEPDKQSRGNAESTAFHETWPGHHLQVATSQSMGGLHRVTRLIWFSGPGEGWARYAEALAEEMGLYRSTTAPIFRRAWPARGMVVDPGIHLYGWTREQAIEFMLEAGRFGATRADEMVDRIAILPGQLTAYDSGGLEIFALRREAEAALGERFDIREFHDRVLENGTIPLLELRAHIERWLASERQARTVRGSD